MYKYETKINSYEDLDKLPEFMQNLEVISNMICSSLKKKSNSVKCHLIKEDDKIILDMIYQAEFFKIPFKIPVLIEPESDNIVFERKMRILQVQNQKLEKTINNFKKNLQKDVDLLKTQLGNVIFLPSCDRPIPIWIKELTLKSKKSVFDKDMYVNVINKGGTALLDYFSNLNICLKSFGSCACTNVKCNCHIKKMDHIRDVFSLISHVRGNENTFIFSSNEIEALSLLKNLKKLTIVGNTSIHSIEVFSSLKNLEELNLIECTSITDLTPISCLKNLRKLDISGCHSIKDLTPISSMTDLETLIMKDTKVENKLCLSQLINLKIISEN
jgi:Leucine-rich repeat (LRR) protein